MPKAGALGPEQYRQATAPVQGAPGDTWYDGLDLRIYDAVNGWILPGGTSNLSSRVSVLSDQISVLSTQISALSQDVSARLVSVNQSISVISQQVSVISAGLGGVQMRWVSTAQGVSSTDAGGIAISGLSVSVATGGIYQLDGAILFQMSVLDALGIAFTFPAMVSSGCAGVLTGGATNSQLTSVVRGTFDEGGSGSIAFSLIVSTVSSLMVKIDALMQVSTAGTIQAFARVSATTKPANIRAGSYLRAYKIV